MGSIGKKVVELEMEGSVLKEEVLLIKERVGFKPINKHTFTSY